MYIFTTMTGKVKNVSQKKRIVEMKNLRLSAVENRRKDGRHEGRNE